MSPLNPSCKYLKLIISFGINVAGWYPFLLSNSTVLLKSYDSAVVIAVTGLKRVRSEDSRVLGLFTCLDLLNTREAILSGLERNKLLVVWNNLTLAKLLKNIVQIIDDHTAIRFNTSVMQIDDIFRAKELNTVAYPELYPSRLSRKDDIYFKRHHGVIFNCYIDNVGKGYAWHSDETDRQKKKHGKQCGRNYPISFLW